MNCFVRRIMVVHNVHFFWLLELCLYRCLPLPAHSSELPPRTAHYCSAAGVAEASNV